MGAAAAFVANRPGTSASRNRARSGTLRSLVAMATMGFIAGPTIARAGPVHEAARDGDLTRVEGLIGKDPKLVHAQDDHHFTPLHWAAANGHKDVMASLLDHGADPNAKTDVGMTPLLLAKECRKDLVVYLADHGADVLAKGNTGWTALHNAAQAGSMDGAAYLLAKGLDVDARCKGPFGTPLTLAAANGRTGVARLLLEKGADVNVWTDEGATPLHDAASRGHAGVVEFLLSRRADVNARRAKGASSSDPGEDGGTPLHDAVQRGHEEVVGLLIAGGADVNSRSTLGRTPLHLAAAKDRTGIVKRLLDGRADVAAFSDEGLTPLHAIVSHGDLDAAALVLDRGADVNLRTKPSSLRAIITAKGPGPARPSENTPLHVAASADRPDMIKLLLSKKADANVKNSLGQTPLQLAKSAAVVELLREAAGRKE